MVILIDALDEGDPPEQQQADLHLPHANVPPSKHTCM